MGKGKRKQKQDSDEEIEDVMAWGKSKANYYREQQDEYSQASEQQEQAKQIYQNQHRVLNKEDFYQLPEQDEADQEQLKEEEQEVEGINQEYIKNEILWATQLAKMFEGVRDEKYAFRKKVYDSYLLILMCLKEFKIPYVDQHPLVQSLPDLKRALKHFETQLPKLYENINGNQDEKIDNTQGDYEEEDGIEGDESDLDRSMQGQEDEIDQLQQDQLSQQISPQIKKSKKDNKQGLKIYQQFKAQKQQERKARKAENKAIREQQRPKQAFRLVTENEGRLANEKILKNKGLMKRRRRDDGNSRTKLRHKYEKALVKRRAKGYIGVKENPGRFYQGEEKVLYGKIASTKLK